MSGFEVRILPHGDQFRVTDGIGPGGIFNIYHVTRWRQFSILARLTLVCIAPDYILDLLMHLAFGIDPALDDLYLVELRNFMRVALATGYCAASTAAEHLGMHERTLNRELKKVGTNYRRELEYVRYDTACKMPADSNTNLARITTTLGYSDTTASIRAFKRWSESSPEQRRSELSSQEALLGQDC